MANDAHDGLGSNVITVFAIVITLTIKTVFVRLAMTWHANGDHQAVWPRQLKHRDCPGRTPDHWRSSNRSTPCDGPALPSSATCGQAVRLIASLPRQSSNEIDKGIEPPV